MWNGGSHSSFGEANEDMIMESRIPSILSENHNNSVVTDPGMYMLINSLQQQISSLQKQTQKSKKVTRDASTQTGGSGRSFDEFLKNGTDAHSKLSTAISNAIERNALYIEGIESKRKRNQSAKEIFEELGWIDEVTDEMKGAVKKRIVSVLSSRKYTQKQKENVPPPASLRYTSTPRRQLTNNPSSLNTTYEIPHHISPLTRHATPLTHHATLSAFHVTPPETPPLQTLPGVQTQSQTPPSLPSTKLPQPPSQPATPTQPLPSLSQTPIPSSSTPRSQPTSPPNHLSHESMSCFDPLFCPPEKVEKDQIVALAYEECFYICRTIGDVANKKVRCIEYKREGDTFHLPKKPKKSNELIEYIIHNRVLVKEDGSIANLEEITRRYDVFCTKWFKQ